jgi:hypothetical protein
VIVAPADPHAIALKEGDAVRLRHDPARLHLFDAAGRAIAHGGEKVA